MYMLIPWIGDPHGYGRGKYTLEGQHNQQVPGVSFKWCVLYVGAA
jgi:hypothetical protein